VGEGRARSKGGRVEGGACPRGGRSTAGAAGPGVAQRRHVHAGGSVRGRGKERGGTGERERATGRGWAATHDEKRRKTTKNNVGSSPEKKALVGAKEKFVD
jgi:hypothetical protein